MNAPAGVLTYRLDLPRWDVGPSVPYRTKAGKVRHRMHRPVWDALTGNARAGHWGQRASAVTEVIDAVGWITKSAKVPAGSHLTVRLVWAPGDNRHADEDNLWPLQKVIADALARGPRKDLPGLRLVPDDDARWMTKLSPRIDRPPVPAGLWLELEVRP